jgi:hypothetical protein
MDMSITLNVSNLGLIVLGGTVALLGSVVVITLAWLFPTDDDD